MSDYGDEDFENYDDEDFEVDLVGTACMDEIQV